MPAVTAPVTVIGAPDIRDKVLVTLVAARFKAVLCTAVANTLAAVLNCKLPAVNANKFMLFVPVVTDNNPVVLSIPCWNRKPAPPVAKVMPPEPALIDPYVTLPASAPAANDPAVITPCVTVTGVTICGVLEVKDTAPNAPPVAVIAPVVIPVPITVTFPASPSGAEVLIAPSVTAPLATASTEPPLPCVDDVLTATLERLMLPVADVLNV